MERESGKKRRVGGDVEEGGYSNELESEGEEKRQKTNMFYYSWEELDGPTDIDEEGLDLEEKQYFNGEDLEQINNLATQKIEKLFGVKIDEGQLNKDVVDGEVNETDVVSTSGTQTTELAVPKSIPKEIRPLVRRKIKVFKAEHINPVLMSIKAEAPRHFMKLAFQALTIGAPDSCVLYTWQALVIDLILKSEMIAKKKKRSSHPTAVKIIEHYNQTLFDNNTLATTFRLCRASFDDKVVEYTTALLTLHEQEATKLKTLFDDKVKCSSPTIHSTKSDDISLKTALDHANNCIRLVLCLAVRQDKSRKKK